MHRHYCTHNCGDYFVCSSDPDRCPRGWICDTCEMDMLDAYWRTNPHQAPMDFDRSEPEPVHAHDKEKTRP